MSRLHVSGMRCGGCAGRVTKVIAGIDPKAQVAIDLASGAVTVNNAETETRVFIAALVEAGFGVAGA